MHGMNLHKTAAWAWLVLVSALLLYIFVELVVLLTRAIARRDWLFIGIYVGGLLVYGLALILIRLHFRYAPSALSHVTTIDLNSPPADESR